MNELHLKKLGLTPKWLELGIIDSQLVEQELNQEDQDTEPTEHFRFGAIHNWLQNLDACHIDMAEVCELLSNDPDRHLAKGAFKEIMACGKLTNQQFEDVAAFVSNKYPNIEVYIEQIRLQRQLQNNCLDDLLFARCIEKGERDIQIALINHPKISKPQLIALSENGYSKKVRNLARQALKKRNT